jgi:hypothetical protein
MFHVKPFCAFPRGTLTPQCGTFNLHINTNLNPVLSPGNVLQLLGVITALSNAQGLNLANMLTWMKQSIPPPNQENSYPPIQPILNVKHPYPKIYNIT